MISQLLALLVIIIFGVTLYNQFYKSLHYNEEEKEKPSLTSNLTYKEAENILSSPNMEESHIILNESLLCINESLKLLENLSPNLSLIPININYTLPTFLKTNITNNTNTTNFSLNIARSDFELYYLKYIQLSNKANHITESTFQSFKNFSNYFNNIKKEMEKIESDFELYFKSLCLPIILNEKEKDLNSNSKKRRLDDLILYKNTINELGELTSGYFDFYKTSFEDFRINIEDISTNSKLVNAKIREAFLIYNNILNSTNEANLHDNLLLSKKTFTDLKSEMAENQKKFEEAYKNFEYKYNNTISNFEDIDFKYNETTEDLKSLHNSIIEQTLKEDKNKNYSYNLNAPRIIDYSLISSVKLLSKLIIKRQNELNSEMEEIIRDINVEAKTSLDLLFIMDITGSMNNYLEEAKNNLINIINRIISECPGIDINLGFIGYRDIKEFSIGDYSDVDFTRNYTYVQEVIEDVWAYGGGDIPEDIAGAFELALNKTWKNNARFAILVADAPCHGEICYSDYYGYYRDDYPNGVPGRRNITDLVEELAEFQISLFCMRITYLTENMFELFKNIYKNHKNVEFHLEDDNSEKDFSDIIVESASKVYVNKRNIDFEYPNLKLEASSILNKLFGISYDFSLVLFEQEIIICLVPKITVTLSESCDFGIGDSKYYYIEIANSLEIGKKGSLDINLVYTYLDKIFNLTGEFNQRFNGVIPKGKILITIEGNALSILFILYNSKDLFSCGGTIKITIEPPKYAPELEYAFNEEKKPAENIFSSLKEGFGKVLTSVGNSVQKIFSDVIDLPNKIIYTLEKSIEGVGMPSPAAVVIPATAIAFLLLVSAFALI